VLLYHKAYTAARSQQFSLTEASRENDGTPGNTLRDAK